MSHSIHMLSIQIDTQKPLIGYSLLVEQHQFFFKPYEVEFLRWCMVIRYYRVNIGHYRAKNSVSNNWLRRVEVNWFDCVHLEFRACKVLSPILWISVANLAEDGISFIFCCVHIAIILMDFFFSSLQRSAKFEAICFKSMARRLIPWCYLMSLDLQWHCQKKFMYQSKTIQR